MIEQAARKERWIVLTGLAAVAAIGLFFTLRLGDMLMMPTAFIAGAIVYPLLLFIMWWTMMMAMMLPSAAPAILTYGALSRKFAEKGYPAPPIAVFVAGYVVIWTSFAAATVALQVLLSKTIPLSQSLTSNRPPGRSTRNISA